MHPEQTLGAVFAVLVLGAILACRERKLWAAAEKKFLSFSKAMKVQGSLG